MRSHLSSVLFALTLAACATDLRPASDPTQAPDAPLTDAVSQPNQVSTFEDLASTASAFERYGEEFDVPPDLLVALSIEATSHQMVVGESEFDGQVPTFGVMALREDVAEEAADLAGVSLDDAMYDRDANIAAAAALLSAWGDEDPDLVRDDIDSWAPIVVRYSGIEEDLAQSAYVHEQVYPVLRDGADLEGLHLEARKVYPDFPLWSEPSNASGGDRSYAVWRPSPNNSARPSGSAGKPSMVIIHTCEGGYSGCWGWLRNTAAKASAHYVVNATGSEVSQLVLESRKAWHISATYQCSRNSSVDCWRNGSSSNNFTIGIEHAGYASQSSWNSGLIDKSARLTCDITKSHGIPRDSYHIVGHGQLQPYNRTDPGKNWPWSTYIAKVKSKCGDTGSSGGGSTGGGSTTVPTGTRVIDSNNARNDTANQKVVVSSNWTSSANVGGYYGTGYWWRTTGSTSDAAEFRFKNDKTRCYTVQAWWTAASDRSKSAPFVMLDSAGKRLDTVNVDQTARHAQWVKLGTYDFPAGWNTVALSRWTSASGVVIADAVRLVPATTCASSTSTAKTPIDIIVDSNNGKNDTSKAKVTIGSRWTRSSSTAGYYGNDYAWGPTESVSDPFSFAFNLPEKRKVTIKARWTAGSNRSTAAPFMLWSPSGTLLDKVTKDQTKNHAKWVTLGTWTLPAGWNKVDLSRWAPAGKVVVADAIRVQSAD